MPNGDRSADRPQTVRFGFSAQKMRGVYAGKFGMEVRSDSFGPAGETWEVSLPLSEFRPLQPQLAFAPEGLELTEVYALTIQKEAGLEINHIELGQRRGPRQAQRIHEHWHLEALSCRRGSVVRDGSVRRRTR